ncbi:MAG: TIR domain-containing protein [Rhizobacter sp.]|nr:TIR domain-containing protein [Rhizobacter sp.]
MSKVTPIRPPGAGGAEPPISVRPEPVEGSAHNADATNAPKYWAFLSYSHHDKLIAKRLQKQLETYRVPRRLVGRETSHGPVPARVSPVFRDRDELHAGADLKASVQDALSKSRWLIVVCTPDAARSPWVNREIIEFKKLHGERRVLALIARGEPFASDMAGREAEECFPPALRRALNDQGVPEGELLEPIAADMRKHGDGPQRATLKLLAGMLGVSFDDLVRRDMQRRVRLLSAVAGASVLGLVAFAFLAVMAVQARNEAQHQRVQAEGLIEFMLGDLRKKLEPVGRLEVLDSVGEKALAYYGAQESGKLDATALGHRSRAMHLIGEIRDLRGNLADAQAAFEQAAETTAQLLAQAPGDEKRVFDHSQSVFWVGYAAWKRADGRMAETTFREYLTLTERLAAMDPDNLDWRAEVAFAHLNLGTVMLGMGQPADALKSLQASGELLTKLSAQRPQLSFELAINHGWRADAHELLGDYEQALAEQRLRLGVLRRMPDADKNRAAQRGILSALHSIGLSELALGRVTAAEVDIRDALGIADRLVGEDPKNVQWWGDACSARLRLVEVLLSQGRSREASAEYELASSCVAHYKSAGSRGVRDAMQLSARVLTLAVPFVPPAQRARLAGDIERFLDVSIPQLTASTPDRAKLAVHLANASLALGDLLMSGNPVGARESWQRAEAQLAPFVSMSDGAVLTSLARARLRLGDIQGAQILVARVQVSSYRHPAYAVLVQQLQAVRGGSRPHE